MDRKSIGIFEYVDPLSDIKLAKLPDFLRLPGLSNEALVIRLLLGHIDVVAMTGKSKKREFNYSLLPFQSAPKLTATEIINSINCYFSTEANAFVLEDHKDALLNYLKSNRRNSEMYRTVLFELSSCFYCFDISPSAAFAHLYRCLEFLSYSFPLVYAAKSKDYKGSFSDLKKFLSGDSSGELKFFKKFLAACFERETGILNYKFEIDIPLSTPFDLLKRDLSGIYKNEFLYEFDTNMLRIKFADMLGLFITTRNRYFHMLVGQGQDNFQSDDYDIEEYFKCINFHILNWLAMIIQKISVFGFYSSLPGI